MTPRQKSTRSGVSPELVQVVPAGREVATVIGFNTAGFAHAETVYAGSQPQNSVNPNSVSQYDVACFQAGQH